jgi:hypothetical protein
MSRQWDAPRVNSGLENARRLEIPLFFPARYYFEDASASTRQQSSQSLLTPYKIRENLAFSTVGIA